MQAKRQKWGADVAKIETNRLVFVDESGINTDMVRRYGRSRGKSRVADHAPVNRPRTTTIVSSIRLDGTAAYAHFSGSMTGDRFLSYLTDTLVPTLKPGDCVVMDNLASHHVKGVVECIRSAGATVLYLPPYSPDLNPIEMLWSKLKAGFRKWRIRSVALLESAIPSAFSLVSPDDCVGWFAADGYY